LASSPKHVPHLSASVHGVPHLNCVVCAAPVSSPFGLTRLQRPNVTESMRMLEEDTERRTHLGFTLDAYGMDLSQYVFNA
jgi:hypothetical protein